MFKLVVLCAFVAAATADPSGLFYSQPLTYSSTVLSPAVTTISKQASSVIHPSPAFYYNTPTAFTHFIKKRSAPLLYPGAYTYAAGSPFLATTYNAPYLASAPALLPAPIAHAPIGYAATAHLIKKRSAPLLAAPAAYSAYNPLIYSSAAIPATSYVAAAPYYSSPVIAHAPLAYANLIKK